MARRTDSRWLVRSSAIALSFGCLAMAAMDRGSAQSFQGTANVVAGQVDSLTTGTGTTDILINGAAPQTVIDWTPTDTSAGATPIAFQNAGTTATFSQSGGGDFAVLNRILPTGAAAGRSVLLDGTIMGRVQTNTPGGRIYFYTPNGLVIGSNAQIDVGALGLTTSSPQVTTGFNGGFIDAGGTVTLTGANSASSVVILPGAQINATQQDQNNYVAIFAPYVEQGGTINVNGSTALIAAEAGTMRWSGGLFDVAVTTGTDGDGSNRAIFHTGSTGGPASAAAGDFHRVFAVAVPKNTAITTLIAAGSALGFDVAGAADVSGNTVVLTGGKDLVAGAPVPSAGSGTGVSNVQVTNSTVTSSLEIYASGYGAVDALGGGLTTLSSSLYIESPVEARIQADALSSGLTIAGDAELNASRSDSSGVNVTGGNAYAFATNGAQIDINGSLVAYADATAGSGGLATGGTARTRVDGGGLLDVGVELSLGALGFIGAGAGDATGGTAELLIDGTGSTVLIGEEIDIDTAGQAGGLSTTLPSGVAGGTGRGGFSQIILTGASSLSVVGGVNVEANGRGGDGNLAASGNGFGGSAIISAGAGSSITFLSDVLMEAAGTSGSVSGGFNSIIANATSGGNATGGTAGLAVTGTGSVITIGADLTIDASAMSDGTSLAGAPGGNAVGGTSQIEASGTGAITVNSSVSLNANGDGGIGSTGPGGSGTGGLARVATLNAGASFQAGGADTEFTVSADGEGGFTGGAGVGGQGRGGTAQISATGGDMDISSTIAVFAGGFGGETVNGDAGVGYGGFAQVTADAGAVVTLTADIVSVPVVVDAIGVGGIASGSGNGGTGSGGQASIAAFAGGAVDVVGDLLIGAVSEGGNGANGGAGNGLLNPVFGAPAFSGITASTGTISVTGATTMLATGTGGDALVAGGAGGIASGGSVSVYSDGSGGAASITLNALTAFADATGGAGAAGAPGATGGVGGAVTAGAIGIGGTADNGDLVTANVTASVSATGGDGGDGGDNPSGTGGTGGMGGNARGGAVIMGLFDSTTVGAPGSATFGDVIVNAIATAGTGGNGGTGLTTDGNGGLGGSAIAAAIGTAPAGFLIDGPSQILARGGSVVMGDYTLLANAIGGAGGSGAAFGQGGNAVAGGFDIDVRAGNASGLAGSLITNDTSATLLATAGGAGGNELFGSGPRVSVKGGSATLVDLTVVQTGNSPVAVPVARSSELSIVDGALNVDSLSITTNGLMSVFVDNGAVFSADITLSAGTFVDDSAGLVPVNPGLLVGDVVDIITPGNIILDAGILSGSDILLSASGTIQTFALTSDGRVSAFAGGSVRVGDVSAATDIEITAGIGALTFNSLQAGQDVDLIVGDSIVGLTIDAGDSVTVEVEDAINLAGDITAGIFNPFGGTGAAYSVGLLANNAINVAGGVFANGQIGIGTQNGSVSGELLSAGSDILVLARTGVALNSIDASNGVVYIADSSMFALSPSIDPFDPAPILAAAPVAMAGPISIGDVFGTRVVAATTGGATFGDVFAPDSIFIRGNGVFGIEFAAGNAIRLESTGLMSMLGAFTDTGNIDLLSGGTVVASQIDAGGSVAIQAAQDIALFSDESDTDVIPGAISAGGTVRLVAQSGSIFDISSESSLGNPVPPQASITAGGTILALAGDSVALRSLTSSTSGIHIANSSMAQFGGSFDNFNIGAVIGRTPTPVGGSVLLSGNASGLGMRAASLGAMSVRGVTVTLLAELRTNGLLSLDGVVSGQNIVTSAADIAIGANGRISAPTGSVALLSNNAGGMFVGDTGLTGGYQISAAEFARVSGGSVNVIGLDITGQAIDMVIGDLAVTGPLAGSTLESNNGALRFGTGLPSAQTPSGGIRITGRLTARGFTPTNQLGFFTETLQLDANSGLIEIVSEGTLLSGELVIGANRFHAAEVSILDRLLANPLYSGRAADINTPLATSRPNGIVRADDIDTDAASQILIQNTGTRELPAGVFAFSEGPLERDVIPPQGSIDFIVNGQLITDAGQLTGTAVFDHLISADNRPFFTPESTVNGCLISGTTCTLEEPQPDVTEMDTEFLPSDSITHFTQEPAREEQAIDPEEREEAEEEAKRAPIPPPTPIISTQPLAPVIDVEEPVAGAGNPGLISSAPTPAGQGRETAQ